MGEEGEAVTKNEVLERKGGRREGEEKEKRRERKQTQSRSEGRRAPRLHRPQTGDTRSHGPFLKAGEDRSWQAYDEPRESQAATKRMSL